MEIVHEVVRVQYHLRRLVREAERQATLEIVAAISVERVRGERQFRADCERHVDERVAVRVARIVYARDRLQTRVHNKVHAQPSGDREKARIASG